MFSSGIDSRILNVSVQHVPSCAILSQTAISLRIISLPEVASEEELELALRQVSRKLELEGFIKTTSFYDFWIRACSPECCLPSDAFSRILLVFGSTYVCEQLLSGIVSNPKSVPSCLTDICWIFYGYHALLTKWTSKK